MLQRRVKPCVPKNLARPQNLMVNGTMIRQPAAGSGRGSTASADVRRRRPAAATVTGKARVASSPISVPPTVIARKEGLAQMARASTGTFAVTRTNTALSRSHIVAPRVGVNPPAIAVRHAGQTTPGS